MVSHNSYKLFDLHKSNCIDPDSPLDWCRSARMRDKLMAEIHALEERLATIEESEAGIDFSLRQTCREMIHSRQQLYLQLKP